MQRFGVFIPSYIVKGFFMVFSITKNRKGDVSQELTIHQAKTDRQNRPNRA